ncbi:MAG: MarR family transcriptional regulator, partial [bacterium]
MPKRFRKEPRRVGGANPAPERDPRTPDAVEMDGTAEQVGGTAAETDPATPRIPTERYDLKILQSLRKIMRGVNTYSRRLIGTHDITAPQLVCLITIAEQGPLSLKRIADRVYLSSSTVVG